LPCKPVTLVLLARYYTAKYTKFPGQLEKGVDLIREGGITLFVIQLLSCI